MDYFLSFLLSFILQYGYLAVFLIVAIGELGIPIPSSTVLVAAGSFAVDGTLNINILIPLAAITAIVGDCLGYWFGKKYGRELFISSFHKYGFTEKRISHAEEILIRYGAWFIFLSRWLLTPIGVPINVVSGMSNYPFLRFFLFIFIGEWLWATIFVLLGYFFGANWLGLTTYLSNAPWIFVLITGGAVSFIIANRMRKKMR